MNPRVTNIGAAILAGGKNSRMSGFNKAFIRINGIPLIQKSFECLEKIFEEVIIVTNSPGDFTSYEKKAIITKDLIKGVGPLGGIYSALSVTSKEAVFFVACDMPFLHNALIRKELSFFDSIDCDSLIPRIGDFREPLHAIYRKNLKDDIRNFVENNDYSIKTFLLRVDAYYWDLANSRFHRNIFRNLNTEEDLKKVKGSLCR